jgi:hypothetical protein
MGGKVATSKLELNLFINHQHVDKLLLCNGFGKEFLVI